MHSKRILIVGNTEILISGLFSKLTRQTGLDVHQISNMDTDSIITELQNTKADVLLVEDTLAFEIPEILCRLPANQKLQLIIISTKENKIQLFDTQKIEIHSMSDFINVL